jgi:hypothetical protein
MKVLLIWELIPDETQLYLFDGESELGKAAIAAHGEFVNSAEDCENASRLDDLLTSDIEPISDEEPFMLDGPITIVRAGFLV